MSVTSTYINMITPVVQPGEHCVHPITLACTGYLSHLECLNPEVWQCEAVYVGVDSALVLPPGGQFSTWEALGVKGRLRHRFEPGIQITIRVRNIGQKPKAFTGRLHIEYLI